MRNISFALTTAQIRQQTKTVTRRMGWTSLRPGTLLQPVVKSQGLKKGETVDRIGAAVRVVSVRHERLADMGHDDAGELAREGFPEMTLGQFFEMFCDANNCSIEDWVTRIEFEYTEPKS